jgi:hypothetical protein
MAAPVADSPRRFRIREVFGALSLASTWAAGVVGALTVWAVGDPLAMGAQMWMAMNTEPHRPTLPFPVTSTVLLALSPLPFAIARKWNWAHVAALAFAAWPWVHFRALYLEAGRP